MRHCFFLALFSFSTLIAFAESGPSKRMERSPYIKEIQMKYNVPYIEVFASGHALLDCFNKKQVDIKIEESLTYIIPRYVFAANGEPCSSANTEFKHEKLADLDPSNPASYRVAVLGFSGWHYYNLKEEKKK